MPNALAFWGKTQPREAAEYPNHPAALGDKASMRPGREWPRR